MQLELTFSHLKSYKIIDDSPYIRFNNNKMKTRKINDLAIHDCHFSSVAAASHAASHTCQRRHKMAQLHRRQTPIVSYH